MKKTIYTITIIAIALMFSSCYFEDDTVIAKADISKIKLSSDFKELTFKAMEAPNFSVKVEQLGEQKPLHYEWAYGKYNKASGYFIKDDINIISNDSVLKYKFPYLGEYGLRLIVDNGEDVQALEFKLTVSAGYDEGLAILTKDDQNKGHFAFLKTLTAQEIADSIKPSVIPDFLSDYPINNPRSIITHENKRAPKAIIFSDDSRITVLNQQTMAVDMIARPPQIAGKTTDLSCFYGKINSETLGCYCLTSDKKVYRFDASLGEMFTMKMVKYHKYSYEDIDAEQLIKSIDRYAFYVNHTKSMIWNPYSSNGFFQDYSKNYNLLSVGIVDYFVYILAISKENPKEYDVLKDTKSLKKFKKLNKKPYTLPAESTITNKTQFINGKKYKGYLYYVYKNKIYRWDYKHRGIPDVKDSLPFDIPADEEISCISFNGSKGTKLFVCTYSPNRAGDLKGSIYVYEPDKFKRLNAFEGSIHKAVDLVYKKL